MREIKFRGWDEKNKEMVYNINLLFSNRLNDCFEEYEECGLKIMQYTGLKDKNGKEIYEGDVHGFGDCTFEVRHGSYKDEMTREESYGWHVYDECDGTGCDLGESEIWVNIIGNIHENPELLEVHP